ncbi:type 2 periplasmic-binding domain-containing protein [Cohnella rhizosphaerae]|uniref:Uncharacterized protein n=1 Tax=Cohnella rhizosphaerae TaxID=1457232 RepID=A0A9X4KRC9_9BACL|nr:hypothetical protein [Cohnella rhizosphaerae]MDG0809402.1 hypothetical protein [Cohnella rhizosphaerae]
MTQRKRWIKGGGRRRWSLLLLGTIVALTLALQGCGNKNEEGAASSAAASSPSAAASTATSSTAAASSQAASTASAEPERHVPEVINYGYIGLNDQNQTTGAEGWGFYKGIIQEELKKYGVKEVKLAGFPNGPDQTESLISGRLDFGSLGDTPAIIARAGGREDASHRAAFYPYDRLPHCQEGRPQDFAGSEGQDDRHPEGFLHAPLRRRAAQGCGRYGL